MENELICVATFVARQDKEKELFELLFSLIEPTRKESGCISYELHQSLDDSSIFTLIEKFVDKESFEFHSNQPYLLNLKEVVGDLISSLSINTYKVAERSTL